MARSFKVQLKTGAELTLIAARYETDGSGTRFFEEDGGVVASFTDGMVAYVLPGDVVITEPTPAPVEVPMADEPPAPADDTQP